MTFIDDNYLDGIITRMSVEHKENIMRTAKRLNLPDDDVLFLYIGAVEYTVQLCEEILGGISNERQKIEQSAQGTQAASLEQAKTLIQNLTQVGQAIAAQMQQSGMASTSAIAEANTEVLNQSRATVREATSLKEEITAVRASVETDRQTFEDVLRTLLQRIGQVLQGLNATITQIDDSQKAVKKLQQNLIWLKFAQWFSPLAALVIALLIGAGGGGGMMWLKYNDSLSALGRDLVNWNATRILKCRQDNNPKCTIWIKPPPERAEVTVKRAR